MSTPVPHDPEIDAFVNEQEGELGQVVATLVDLVRETLGEHTEHMHHGAPWFRVGGAHVCYVAAHTSHVNLGFRYGAELEDPDGLLEGTGKSMRHVKVRGPESVPREALLRLVEEAAERS